MCFIKNTRIFFFFTQVFNLKIINLFNIISIFYIILITLFGIIFITSFNITFITLFRSILITFLTNANKQKLLSALTLYQFRLIVRILSCKNVNALF